MSLCKMESWYNQCIIVSLAIIMSRYISKEKQMKTRVVIVLPDDSRMCHEWVMVMKGDQQILDPVICFYSW